MADLPTSEIVPKKRWTLTARLSLILAVPACLLVGFHFQDSCRLSGTVGLVGLVVSLVALVLACASNNNSVALAALLALLGHLFLRH